MAITLTSKFVNVGSHGSAYHSEYGFRSVDSSPYGTLSETVNGSSAPTTDNIYSSTLTILSVRHVGSSGVNGVYLLTDGQRSNSSNDWTTLQIGSTNFSRSAATYSYPSSTRTQWFWSTTTNPFGTTANADVSVKILLNSYTGGSASISATSLTGSSTSDVTVTLSSAGSSNRYRIIKDAGTTAGSDANGTVFDSRTGNGGMTLSYSEGELPSGGVTADYQIQQGGPYSQTSDDDAWIDWGGFNNNFTITRGSTQATYSLAANPTSIAEGSTTRFTITTSNVANNTRIWWDAVGIPSTGSAGSSDISPNDGYVDIVSNTAYFDVTAQTDTEYSEGTETFRGRIFTDSSRSNQVASDTYVTITNVGQSITPPSGVSVATTSIVNSSTVGVTVSVTSNGSGGNLEFAQTTTNSVPATGWQSSSSFNQPNNSTRYYWASQDQDTSGTFASSVTFTVAKAADLIIDTINTQYINNDATSFPITIANGDSDTTYRVRSTNISGAIEGSRTGNGTLTVYDVPGDDSSKTYFLSGQGGTNTGHSESEIQTFEAVTADAYYSNISLSGNANTQLTGSTEVLSLPSAGATVSRVSGTAEFAVGTSTTPGTYSTANKNITNGQYLYARDTTGASGTKTSTFSINSVQRTFSVTSGLSSSTYGLELTGPNGTSIVFSPNRKTFTYVDAGQVTLQASGNSGDSHTFTGIANATDDTKIAVDTGPTGVSYDPNASLITVSRSTANGGSITLTNNYVGNSFVVSYRIVRLG
jgi:hypothetical protein